MNKIKVTLCVLGENMNSFSMQKNLKIKIKNDYYSHNIHNNSDLIIITCCIHSEIRALFGKRISDPLTGSPRERR